MVRIVECFRPRIYRQAMAKRPAAGPADAEVVQVAGRVPRLGPREEAMTARITKHVAAKPAATVQVLWLLWQYMQIRCMLDRTGLWYPALGAEERPFFARGTTAA